MINSREEFEYTIQSVAKMYGIRDRDAAETLYHPSTRDAVVESTKSMIRKLEREIAEYLAVHPIADEEDGRREADADDEAAVREPVAA